MRKGFLGSIAAIAAGAGAAWGQAPMPVAPAGDPPPPAAISSAGGVMQVQAVQPPYAGAGLGHGAPAQTIMPNIGFGPASDPQGLGPVGGVGPAPSPLYPNPGPYGAPAFQPGPPDLTAGYGGAPHWWTSVDYLLFFSKAQPINFPLVTSSAPSDLGLLGQPSTLVLVGNKNISYNPFSGGRMTIGFFGDNDRRYGFEASGFGFADVSKSFDFTSMPVANSSGIPVLARPFIDSATGNSSLILSNTGYATAKVLVETKSQAYSIEASGVLNIFRTEPDAKCAFSVDLIGGYRYFQLKEDLSVESLSTLIISPTTTSILATGPFGISTVVGTSTTPGTTSVGGVTVQTPTVIIVKDDFSITNMFNGGQVGIRGEVRYGMFTLTGSGKLAFGEMHEQLNITGGTAFANIATSQFGTAYGGLLANASNIGHYTKDEFVYMPEGNLNLGVAISKSLSAFVGYNFLYVNHVARPGAQINSTVNSATVPLSANYGATDRPNVTQNLMNQSDYWLMGINFGFKLVY